MASTPGRQNPIRYRGYEYDEESGLYYLRSRYYTPDTGRFISADGVAYFSKRVEDEVFAFAAINIALFTNYEKGKKYSEICKHIKVDESYNFAMFKQLGDVDKKKEYEDYRVLQTGLTTKIGKYNRQFTFGETEFCKFDKFLFSTWKDKEKVKYGNAL